MSMYFATSTSPPSPKLLFREKPSNLGACPNRLREIVDQAGRKPHVGKQVADPICTGSGTTLLYPLRAGLSTHRSTWRLNSKILVFTGSQGIIPLPRQARRSWQTGRKMDLLQVGLPVPSLQAKRALLAINTTMLARPLEKWRLLRFVPSVRSTDHSTTGLSNR